MWSGLLYSDDGTYYAPPQSMRENVSVRYDRFGIFEFNKNHTLTHNNHILFTAYYVQNDCYDTNDIDLFAQTM